MVRKRRRFSWIRQVFHRLVVAGGAVGLTLVFFLVLPLMQAISKPPEADLTVQNMGTADLPPPPPPPPEEKPEEKPEEVKEPPKLTEEAARLDLEQIALALDPMFTDSTAGADFAVKLNTVAAEETASDIDAIFSPGDLDQKPRVVSQASPTLTRKLRDKAPGTVYIIFIVDERGRVESPVVQKSDDAIFEGPALSAVKQWRFEPGKRNGQPVRFRMRVPITFAKGR